MMFETKSLESSKIQLIDGDRGKNYPKQADFTQQGDCLFLSAKNVTLSGFEFSETLFIKKEKDKTLRAGKLRRGDIVVTTRGTIGNIAFYSDDVLYEHVRINSGMMIFRVDERFWNRRFLYFLLTSNFIKQQIKSLTSGSAVPQLPARDLKKFELPKIPKDIQDCIEKIIGSISDKIELNRKTNQTLEQIAQAIFKSWFVDFEPVKAKIQAKQEWARSMTAKDGGNDENAEAIFVELAAMCAISGAVHGCTNTASAGSAEAVKQLPLETQQQLKTIAALFPDALVESELGEIPEGWCGESLSSWGDVVCGKTPSKKKEKYYGGGIPFIKIPDMHGNMFVIRTTDSLTIEGANTQNKKMLPKGSVCVSCIATVGQVLITNEDSFTNQQINSIVPLNGYSTSYLYFSMLGLYDHLHDLASGGSATLNLNTGNFSKIVVIKPSNEILKSFSKIVEPMMENILSNYHQKKNLATIRDSLLPKLLSGEINLNHTTTKKDAVA